MTTEPSKVFFRACSDYSLEKVTACIEELLEPFSQTMPIKGAKVLLKPNLLKGFSPQFAVTTHPTIVEAVILIGKKRGWSMDVGDSPAIASVESVAKDCGLLKILNKHAIKLVPLNKATYYTTNNGRFPIAKQLENYDAVINLPKLKGHGQMYMTANVKNLFGCVPGKRKAFLHMKIGDKNDGSDFSNMLLQTAKKVVPVINITDAIVSMAGNGPVNGEAVNTGFIGISTNPLALDFALLDMLGGNRKEDPIARAVHKSPEFFKQINYEAQWLSEKSDFSAFYFPTKRVPISFHPFILMRYALRILFSKLKQLFF